MKRFLCIVLVGLLAGNTSFAGSSCCGGTAVAKAPVASCGGVAKAAPSCAGRAKATPVRDLLERAPVRSTLSKIIAASKAKSSCSGVKSCSGVQAKACGG